MELNAKVASLTRKIEAIEMGRSKQLVTVCGICDCDTHSSEDCPTIPTFKEVLQEQFNATNAYPRPFNNQLGNSYSPTWRNHPNFSWRNRPTANQESVPRRPTQQGGDFRPSQGAQYTPPPPQSQNRSLEDLLINLIQTQNSIIQNNQQSFLDFQKEVRTSIGQLSNTLQNREKGAFPAQPHPA